MGECIQKVSKKEREEDKGRRKRMKEGNKRMNELDERNVGKY